MKMTLLLISSLPGSHSNFVDTLLYGRESLSLEDVQSALISKDLKKKSDAKDRDMNDDGSNVRGRSHKMKINEQRSRPRSQ